MKLAHAASFSIMLLALIAAPIHAQDQPTTKPSGEGTGLGLSLSYDIMKAHGGELKVESRVNEFTEFILTIPA